MTESYLYVLFVRRASAPDYTYQFSVVNYTYTPHLQYVLKQNISSEKILCRAYQDMKENISENMQYVCK